MNTIYLFDVDGTLTPSNQPMQAEFAEFFREFVAGFRVYLISGSDYAKLREQIAPDILENCDGVFGSSGAQYFEKKAEVFSKNHTFSDELIRACEAFVQSSPYPVRTGTHVERRPGMLNISVVGREATPNERHDYHLWDRKSGERHQFVRRINASALPYEASAGGEISVDITPEGWNKSVAKQEILKRNRDARLLFFGDRMVEGGNDKPLADALSLASEPHGAIAVRDYHDTWTRLKAIVAARQ